MPEGHPSRQTLEQFMRGDLEAGEACHVVGHLLADCPSCRRITGRIWASFEQGLRAAHEDIDDTEPPPPSSYAAIFDRAVTRAGRDAVKLVRERDEAPLLLAELISHPQPRRLTLTCNSKRFQTWALCEVLVESSFDCRFDEVQSGVELAELAVTVAERLDPERYGTRQVQDLQGRAWAYLGNARRVASDLRGADAAFQVAERCCNSGTADRLDRALLCRFKAHLLRARGRFQESHRLQDRAVTLYRECGETALVARTMSDQAVGVLYAGDPERAIGLFEEALSFLDAESEPRMVAAVRHNLAHCFIDAGQYETAQRLLQKVRPVYRQMGDLLSLVRLRWLEGKILQGTGKAEAAEGVLVEARDAFIEQGVAFDAALVSLDLAGVYAVQGRSREMQRLAEQMVPIFESRDLHRETLAALIVFRRAARMESATLALVQEIQAYLWKARHQPGLPFRPS